MIGYHFMCCLVFFVVLLSIFLGFSDSPNYEIVGFNETSHNMSSGLMSIQIDLFSNSFELQNCFVDLLLENETERAEDIIDLGTLDVFEKSSFSFEFENLAGESRFEITPVCTLLYE